MPAQGRPEAVDGFAGYMRTCMAVSRRGGVFVIFDVARRIGVTRYIAANILAVDMRLKEAFGKLAIVKMKWGNSE